MKFTIRTLIWTLVIVALVVAGIWAMIPNPVDVEYAVAGVGPLRVTVQEDGKTRIREKYVVSAPVAGTLSRIDLNEGDPIVAGESLLAVILPTEPEILDARARAEANARVSAAEAGLKRAEAAIEQARIDRELAEARFRRAEGLLPERAIPQEEFDIARNAWLSSVQAEKTAAFDAEIAGFELDMARATVLQFSDSRADTGFEPFEIHAPVTGKVLRVMQESAAVVAVGTPLLELGDPQNLELEIDVLSTDAVRIRPGAEVTIEHWGGDAPLRGRVRVIEPAAFTRISSLGVEEQRVNIIADFDEPPERIAALGDGYRIEAKITVDSLDEALLIPNSALFRHEHQWHVFRIEDGKAALRPVTIGLQNETHTRIVDGLAAGDQVILYPADTIQAGVRVRPVPAAGPPPPNESANLSVEGAPFAMM
jgi:HlyD family secretion protein